MKVGRAGLCIVVTALVIASTVPLGAATVSAGPAYEAEATELEGAAERVTADILGSVETEVNTHRYVTEFAIVEPMETPADARVEADRVDSEYDLEPADALADDLRALADDLEAFQTTAATHADAIQNLPNSNESPEDVQRAANEDIEEFNEDVLEPWNDRFAHAERVEPVEPVSLPEHPNAAIWEATDQQERPDPNDEMSGFGVGVSVLVVATLTARILDGDQRNPG